MNEYVTAFLSHMLSGAKIGAAMSLGFYIIWSYRAVKVMRDAIRCAENEARERIAREAADDAAR